MFLTFLLNQVLKPEGLGYSQIIYTETYIVKLRLKPYEINPDTEELEGESTKHMLSKSAQELMS